MTYTDPFGLCPTCDPTEWARQFGEGLWNYIGSRLKDLYTSAARALEADVRLRTGPVQTESRANAAGESSVRIDIVATPVAASATIAAGVRLSNPAPGSTTASLNFAVPVSPFISAGVRADFSIDGEGNSQLDAVKATVGASARFPGWRIPLTPGTGVRNLLCVGTLCPGGTSPP